MIDIHDSLVIHCVQLGGEIPFRYCRTVNENLPCRRIASCWEFRMDIASFLNDLYSEEDLQKIFSPPTRTRIETILELVEQAKGRRGNS